AYESTSNDAKKDKVPIRNGLIFVFNEMDNPILFLLFDIGAVRSNKSIASPVEVSYSSKIENIPRVWAIHSRGHDEKVFGCLQLMGCVEASKMFFISAVSDVSVHDQITRRNERFYELRRSFRCLPAVKS